MPARRFTPPRATPVTFDEVRARKLDDLDQLRKRHEIGGTEFGGLRIRTDEKSQGKINGAISLFERDSTLTAIDFEAQPGVWVALDGPTMIAVGIAVGRHIQGCFSRARVLSETIAQITDRATLDAFDITTGWPE